MKREIVLSSLVIVLSPFLFVLAQGTGGQSAAATEQALIQMEKDWGQAWLKKDTVTLDRIIADDFVATDHTGKAVTKAEALRDLKSGSSGSQTIELGALKVRVFGQTAVVTGSSVEKSTWQGKDSSGSYVFTDIFVNRNGRWQAVASHATKVK